MRNAKKEFIDHIGDPFMSKIKCAKVHDSLLKIDYTYNDLKKFLNELDFEYDAGYGSQFLYGTIWYVDGTWSARSEYDGSEWWAHKKCPKIPSELIDMNIG